MVLKLVEHILSNENSKIVDLALNVYLFTTFRRKTNFLRLQVIKL